MTAPTFPPTLNQRMVLVATPEQAEQYECYMRSLHRAGNLISNMLQKLMSCRYQTDELQQDRLDLSRAFLILNEERREFIQSLSITQREISHSLIRKLNCASDRTDLISRALDRAMNCESVKRNNILAQIRKSTRALGEQEKCAGRLAKKIRVDLQNGPERPVPPEPLASR